MLCEVVGVVVGVVDSVDDCVVEGDVEGDVDSVVDCEVLGEVLGLVVGLVEGDVLAADKLADNQRLLAYVKCSEMELQKNSGLRHHFCWLRRALGFPG